MATNGDDLINIVGYKVLDNATPDTTSRPTRVQILQWLKDGQLELVRRLLPTLLKDLTSIQTLSGTAGNADLPSSFFKFVSAYEVTNNLQFTFIPLDVWGYIQSDKQEYYGTTDHVCTIINNDLYYEPSAVLATNVRLIQIDEPTAPADSGTPIDLPDEFVPLLVDYAVIQAKMQDEEFQQYQLYMANWYARIQQMNRATFVPDQQFI